MIKKNKKGLSKKRLSKKRLSKKGLSKKGLSKKRLSHTSSTRISKTKTDYRVNIDITDKSILDFKKNKSISIVSKPSDLKSSKIGELYEVKPIHDNMHRICNLKIQAKTEKTNPLPKNISKQLCNCLFEKNKKLTVAELEERVNKREETPASSCITILDNYNHKNSKSISSKSISSKSISSKSVN